MTDTTLTEEEKKRFWAKVDKNGPTPTHAPELEECWLWKGATTGSKNRPNKGEYGRFGLSRDGKQKLWSAHRLGYQIQGGTIPKGQEIDHRCNNPLCVRKSHLEAVTHAENMRRETERRSASGYNRAKPKHSGLPLEFLILHNELQGKTISETQAEHGCSASPIRRVRKGIKSDPDMNALVEETRKPDTEWKAADTIHQARIAAWREDNSPQIRLREQYRQAKEHQTEGK